MPTITKSLVLHAVVNAHAVTCQSSWSYADDISGHVVLTSACGLLFVGKMGTVGCSPQAAWTVRVTTCVCLQAEEEWRAKQAAEVMSRRAARIIQKSWHAYKVKADAEKKKAATADKKKGKGSAKAKKKWYDCGKQMQVLQCHPNYANAVTTTENFVFDLTTKTLSWELYFTTAGASRKLTVGP